MPNGKHSRLRTLNKINTTLRKNNITLRVDNKIAFNKGIRAEVLRMNNLSFFEKLKFILFSN